MNLGDYSLGVTLVAPFSTRRFSTGAPFTLAGSPVISAYEDAGTTEITAGVSLSVDHDARTGFNMVTVVATGGNGFETGKSYSLVITTGTVDSVSVVGEVVGFFTIERAAVKADTAAILVDTGTTLDGRIPAALVSGRIDASVGAMAANVMTAAAAAADLTTELQSGLATAAALDTVDNFLDTEVAAILTAVDTEVAAIKAVTDLLPNGGALSNLDAAVSTRASQASLDGVVADLPTRITKNVALTAFTFFMVDSVDHVTGKTGLTVTATRSLDGAAFGACANAVAEIANGFYKVDLAAGDVNAVVVALKFTAPGADMRAITIVTQP